MESSFPNFVFGGMGTMWFSRGKGPQMFAVDRVSGVGSCGCGEYM